MSGVDIDRTVKEMIGIAESSRVAVFCPHT